MVRQRRDLPQQPLPADAGEAWSMPANAGKPSAKPGAGIDNGRQVLLTSSFAAGCPLLKPSLDRSPLARLDRCRIATGHRQAGGSACKNGQQVG